jgi:hypothetical protein
MSPSFLLVCLLSAFSGAAAASVSVEIASAGRQKIVRSEASLVKASARTEKVSTKLLEHLRLKYMGLLESFAEGDVSPEELARLEEKYGGFVTGVFRHVQSHGEGGDGYHVHQGGDRFTHGIAGRHNYGAAYTEYLNKLFDSQTPIQQVAEVGILKGSGIAMWLELFPGNKVYGFDIDPSNFEANRGNLKKEGMNDANLKILMMDQTLDNSKMLEDQIGGQFTFVVDDGCHTEFCARMTIKSFLPRMTDKFVYIIEDGAGVHLVDEIKGMAPGVNAELRGALTMVSRGL